MAHLRRQIRQAIVTKLTGLTTTGSKVFASRMWPLSLDDLPGLIVYANSENIQRLEIGVQNTQLRNLEISIDAIAKGTTAETVLDTICVEVEEAMAVDKKLSNLAIDSELTSTQIRQAQAESEFFIASLRYAVTYRATDNDVE